MTEIISVRERPEFAQSAVRYFQQKWSTKDSEMVYNDTILSALNATSPLPQWYLLVEGGDILGCAGLITNDFISRGDLWPWLCALYIEEPRRGQGLGGLLIRHVMAEAKRLGFPALYLCTDHVGYYERYGFEYLAIGYHPWGESSRIYQIAL